MTDELWVLMAAARIAATMSPESPDRQMLHDEPGEDRIGADRLGGEVGRPDGGTDQEEQGELDHHQDPRTDQRHPAGAE